MEDEELGALHTEVQRILGHIPTSDVQLTASEIQSLYADIVEATGLEIVVAVDARGTSEDDDEASYQVISPEDDRTVIVTGTLDRCLIYVQGYLAGLKYVSR